MKKKILLLFMCVTMIGINLLGCSSNEKQTNSNTEKSEGSEEPEEDVYTVTMVIGGTQQPDEARIEAKINEILEKELNANLDLVVLPWGSKTQQIQLMLSGDEKIDCLYTDATSSAQYMRAGQIIDMTELINQYGTNVKEIFGEDILESNAIDNFIFGIPTQIERGSIPAIFMRKDITQKYNIDISQIKEPQDMEAIFEIVKAGEPDMTMLYSSSKDDPPVDRLNGFDTLGDANMLGVLMNQEESTEIVNLFASDWYMDTTMMIHDWFEKGYINQDAGTDPENWRSVFKAGNLFSIFFTCHPATAIEFQTSTGYEFEIVTFNDYAIKNSSAYSGTNYSIAQNSENPEKTMQVLDYIYGSSEIMNLLNWGEEGVDYEIVDEENGIIDYPDGVTADNVGYSLNLGWELPNQFITHVWQGSELGIWAKMNEYNDEAHTSKALGFIFDSTGLENQIAALSNVVAQYKGPINSGSVDPEEYIPKFLADLEAAGINEIISNKQEQFDKWLAD